MKSTLAVVSALMGIAFAAPQGVTDKISPTGSAPAGCTGSFSGNFEITVVQVTEKRSVASQPEKRGTCGANGILVMTLKDGVTMDSQSRTGYIASNYQFQFDGPPQAGALFTSGFSVCANNILALGPSKTFYRCLSGTFYNLYDRNWAPQCEAVQIIAIPCGGSSSGSVSQIGDGQVVGTSVVQTTIVTALSDGQPQVVTTTVAIPMCQIGDGQIQVHTTPCASITSVATATSAPVPVSQLSDGQIQVTPPASTVAATTYASATPTKSAAAVTSAVVSKTASVKASTTLPTTTAAATPSIIASSGSFRSQAGSIGALAVAVLTFACLL